MASKDCSNDDVSDYCGSPLDCSYYASYNGSYGCDSDFPKYCFPMVGKVKFHCRLSCNICADSECKDVDSRIDDKFGDGTAKCSDMIPDWCNDSGDYSKEARRACPKTCASCG